MRNIDADTGQLEDSFGKSENVASAESGENNENENSESVKNNKMSKTLTTTTAKVQKRIFKSRNIKSCFFCEFTSITMKPFNEHLLNEHCDLIFCCDICNHYLPRLQLIDHMTAHAHKSASSVKNHMNSKHVRLKLFKCNVCNVNFSSKRVLQNHNRSRHEHKRNYVCPICEKTFKTDSTLYTHQKLHTNDKPHKCSHCQKCFRLKHHLTGHLVQHSSFTELPYECNCCHKKFAAMDNLRKHSKIHDQNNFVCHICGAKMRQKRYLRQHMRKVHLQRATVE